MELSGRDRKSGKRSTLGKWSQNREERSLKMMHDGRLRSKPEQQGVSRVIREPLQVGNRTAAARVFAGLVAACLALAACSTPERRAAVDSCTIEWNSRIPAEIETRTITRHHYEQVPDGTETCTTEVVHDNSEPDRSKYTSKSSCTPNMETVSVPCEVQQEFDIREDERDLRIRDCTARRCLASHGNVSCKGSG